MRRLVIVEFVMISPYCIEEKYIMMRTVVYIVAVMALFFGSAEGVFGGQTAPAPKGEPIPYRVVPLDNISAFVKNWEDESMPYYAIMGNIYEWRAAFSPAATMGGNKVFEPNPDIFEKDALILVARVSEAPPQGHEALFVKSFEFVDGEPILSYGFYPPVSRGAHKVKNTMMIAMPHKYLDGLRISEETETPASMTAARELQEAKDAGRVKQK